MKHEKPIKYLTGESIRTLAVEGNQMSLARRIAPWVLPLLKIRRVSFVPLQVAFDSSPQRNIVRTLAQFRLRKKEMVSLLLDMKRETFESLPSMPRRLSRKAQLAQPSSRYNAV